MYEIIEHKCWQFMLIGLLCTQKKRIRTTVSKKIRVHRTEISSKKYLKWDISLKGTNFGSFRTISRSGDLGSFFSIAALRPWFEYASFEYKEAYFSDNLNFDLYGAEQHIGGQKT